MSAFATPDTGSLQGDLVAFLGRGLEVLDAMDGFGIARPFIAESVRCPGLAGQVRDDLFAGDEAVLEEILCNAEARGELPGREHAANARMLLDTLAGYLLFRRFVLHEPLDAGALEQCCGVVARGLQSGAENSV